MEPWRRINKEEINKFIGQLKCPIYYFNIETFNEAVPRLYGTKPYAQIPFEYSVYVQEENDKLEYHEFLHKDNTNPKKSILDSILKVLGNKGSCLIKNVLTAVTGRNYEKLALDTSELYLKATLEDEFSEEEKSKVYVTLLEDCSEDTKAMVDIILGLKKIN